MKPSGHLMWAYLIKIISPGWSRRMGVSVGRWIQRREPIRYTSRLFICSHSWRPSSTLKSEMRIRPSAREWMVISTGAEPSLIQARTVAIVLGKSFLGERRWGTGEVATGRDADEGGEEGGNGEGEVKRTWLLEEAVPLLDNNVLDIEAVGVVDFFILGVASSSLRILSQLANGSYVRKRGSISVR